MQDWKTLGVRLVAHVKARADIFGWHTRGYPADYFTLHHLTVMSD